MKRRNKMRKYSVSYASGSTGFGWEHEYDKVEEFEEFIDEEKKDVTARVTVWDNELNAFIFWKDCLTFECRIDLLHSFDRDLRTRTRTRKTLA